jgi:hypothetical protein
MGNGCVIKAVICLPPTTLNYDQTKCIPGSEDYIPFPVLAFGVFLALIPLLSKIKARESRFITNMIAFLSIGEKVSIITLLIFAIAFGIKPVVYLVAVALMFEIAIDLFFLIVFTEQIKNDESFKYWCMYNPKVVKTLQIISSIFSFKVYRLLYSIFFGKDEFNAAFTDPYKFFNPLNLASFLNLLLVKLPCLVGCIFTIRYVDWGYQLLIAAYELLIFIVVIIILSITEYFQMRSYLIGQKEYTKIKPKEVNS